jgi:hypothetical protein
MTTAMTHPVTAAAGLPETTLPADLLDRLPASVAAAPWRTRCSVVSWFHAPTRAALDVLPDSLRPDRLSAIAWSLVRYADTPVGPYNELVAVPIAKGRGPVHIPFIVVDSPASIVGGRMNWLLPKALAGFAWSGRSVTVTSDQPADPAWTVSATSRPIGPPLPFASRFSVTQCSTDGEVRRFPARMRGLARYASVTVTGSAAGPLGSLLREGRHRGAVISHGGFTALPLRPEGR